MTTRFYSWLTQRYPQNYIFRKPYVGSCIFMALCFTFTLIYKPVQQHYAPLVSYAFSILIYSIASAIPIILCAKLLRKIPCFSKEEEWTFLKEIVAVVLTLIALGIGAYFVAFAVEPPAPRWNWSTFFDSCLNAFLIGIIPFGVFTATNFRYLFGSPMAEAFFNPSEAEPNEHLIQIDSTLKKEELSFYPGQFIYALSDGNYVIFFLETDNRIQKKSIRNSISNIEQQLSGIPHFMRTHRAFIVNLEKVRSKKGNSLGYQLKLSGTDTEIPVSRQNTGRFNQLMQTIH